eukprot:TRINITY_DN297_c0_g1_i3.p1 TRINITY_DN297_c0_g1~~TRINITY_DN297_c0_g1_i3.p1  ORF type:complete len:264 (-),score=80.19 TRINITY_DN297_c0_g1_i3:28-819(-)
MGGEVILACRSIQKANEARDWIIRDANTTQKLNLVPMELDLSSLKSVKQFTEKIKKKYTKIDVLINNAGVMRVMGEKRNTTDGLEEMMGVNHVAHFLLTQELLELIKKSKSPRIINVSALAHIHAIPGEFFDLNALKSYENWPQYGKSKLANILFSLELQKRLKNTNVCVYSLHPGIIQTDLVRDLPSWFKVIFRISSSLFLKNTEQGAATQIKLASDPSVQKTCGRYWVDCAVGEENDFAKNPENAEKLWNMTDELIEGIKF